MAATKKATKQVATATPALAAAVKQAYITAAHAHIAHLNLSVGDTVYVGSYIGNITRGQVYDRLGNPIAGCNITRAPANSLYGNNVTLQGIDADGNVVVRAQDSTNDVTLPYSFVRQASGNLPVGTVNTQVKLNDSYRGTVTTDGTTIAVGCQRFPVARVRELLALADKQVAASRAAAATKRPAANLTTRAATYTPAPKAPKKVAAKKAVKAK